MPPRSPSEDRLRKVLELERSKRFNDRAVTAGLDVFLRNLTDHEGAQLGSGVSARIEALPDARIPLPQPEAARRLGRWRPARDQGRPRR